MARMGLTVVSGPILARLVGPAAYGIIAPAQSVGALGRLLAESGFAYHTVTARTLNKEQASDLNLQSLRLSLAIAVLAGLGSMAFVGSFEERCVRAILAFALVALAGAAAVPVAWAQRNGHLARLDWWGVIGQAIATFCVAVPAAFYGSRLLALNANLIIPLVLASVVAWLYSGLSFSKVQPAKIPSSYRLGTLSSNFGSYLAGNVDTLLLATYLSQAALGVYTRANLLASLPGTVVSAAVSRVGLVALSKSSEWADHRSFLWKGTVLTIVAFSGLSLIAGLGFDVTGFAFGRLFSTPPLGFAVLTLSQIFFYGGSLLDTYLNVRRKLAFVGLSHTIQAFLSGAGFLILKPTSLLTIAWILLGPSAIRYAAMLFVIALQRGEIVTELEVIEA